MIFESGSIRWQSVTTKIIVAYHELKAITPPRIHRPVDPIDQFIPWAFFDGAAQ